MKPHTKLYLSSMGLHTTDFIKCECCPKEAVDIHHIKARGMGGTKKKDVIENIMALCRDCHENFGDRTYLRTKLYNLHRVFLEQNGIIWNQENIRDWYHG